MVRAALLHTSGGSFDVVDLVLPDPAPDQVRVRIAAAGVCHSDLSLGNGTLRQAFPVVLGHEGAGVVVGVGDDVRDVRVGDHVLLNWSPNCGACWFCRHDEPYLCEHSGDASKTAYAELSDGTPVYAGLGTGAFAEETVVSVRSVIGVPQALDLRLAALLGCAVLTGAGAVMNTARVVRGESVAVIGLGGVGLSVLQAARAVGAQPVIAVDRTPEKQELARVNGATNFVESDPRVGATVRGLTDGRGADHVFDCVGSSATIRAAWSAARRGGAVTVVGIGRADDEVKFSALELFWFARTLRGCVFGSSDPARDIPRLLDLVDRGSIDLSTLITRTTGLAGIDEAFAEMSAGRGARTIIDPSR
jgi:S-(hydroxymethyl)glutathione dehydrogenase/alcohol dehydrogenase